MLKRIVVTILAALLAMPVISSTALAAGTKNETIYAMLGFDGSVDNIYVVNQLLGEYTDYGEYTYIKNLSTLSVPNVEGDKITFPDSDVEGGLYYQGTMQGELPFVFDIRYYLDGEQTGAQELAGASGHLKIEINGSVNGKCSERVREGYMAQISLALDQDLAGGIVSEGATAVSAGNALNLTYVILPGESGSFTLEADVHDFEMSGITITLLKGTISGVEDTINKTEDGFDDMLEGADDMIDGTTELKDGMKSLSGGVSSLSSGMNKLASSGDDMLLGMREYGSGLKNYTDGAIGLASGSADVMRGLDELSANSPGIASGIMNISSGLSSLSASSGDLKALAQSLSSSPDPSVQALAQGMLQTLGTVGQFSSGLDEASKGLGGYAAGVQQAAAGYREFDEHLQALAGSGAQITAGYDGIAGGFESYLSGIKTSAGGATKLNKSIKRLPANIQKLIDGQMEFKDGIVTAKDEITAKTQGFKADDSPAVSFASPDKNHPQSVQYILKTPDIKIPASEETNEAEENNGDFLSRLADLFG